MSAEDIQARGNWRLDRKRRMLRLARRTFRQWLRVSIAIQMGSLFARGRLPRAVAVLAKNREMRVQLRTGVTLSVPYLDVWPLFEVFALQEYDLQGFQWESCEFVVDCGAHVGAFCIWIAQKTHAKILAVEPNPVALRSLEKNLSFLKDRVTILGKAVADHPYRATLYDDGQSAMASLRHQVEASGLSVVRGSATEVSAVTLDTILTQGEFPRVDLLKMDIERSEMDVLGTISPRTMDSIGALMVECHPWKGVDPQLIIDKLTEAGMVVTRRDLLVTATRPRRKMGS